MITESELRSRLIARLETSRTIRPEDLQTARNVAALLVPMVMKIIREEVRAAKALGGEEE